MHHTSSICSRERAREIKREKNCSWKRTLYKYSRCYPVHPIQLDITFHLRISCEYHSTLSYRLISQMSRIEIRHINILHNICTVHHPANGYFDKIFIHVFIFRFLFRFSGYEIYVRMCVIRFGSCV